MLVTELSVSVFNAASTYCVDVLHCPTKANKTEFACHNEREENQVNSKAYLCVLVSKTNAVTFACLY